MNCQSQNIRGSASDVTTSLGSGRAAKPGNSVHQPVGRDCLQIRNALEQLPADVADLNAMYIQEVSHRSLVSSQVTNGWRGHEVQVFLRHDRKRVFAVACGNRVGMADYVALEQVQFRLDETGRQQTLEERGPLPNQTTIHAWLAGRLLWAADQGPQPSTDLWSPVVYNPTRNQRFCCGDDSQPIESSEFALLIPGPVKIWCDQSSVPTAAAVEYVCHEDS